MENPAQLLNNLPRDTFILIVLIVFLAIILATITFRFHSKHGINNLVSPKPPKAKTPEEEADNARKISLEVSMRDRHL